MPRPAVPLDIDGVILSMSQTRWMSGVIDVIYAPDPTRSAASILRQAETSFRKVHAVVRGVWVRNAVVHLGTSDADATLVLPAEV